mgnify:CR=1 FL=1
MGVMIRYRRWLVVALLVAAVAAMALWPAPVPVDVMPSTRGPLSVTVDDEGETRVRHRYVVSAPLSGRVLRLELEPGDPVGGEGESGDGGSGVHHQSVFRRAMDGKTYLPKSDTRSTRIQCLSQHLI